MLFSPQQQPVDTFLMQRAMLWTKMANGKRTRRANSFVFIREWKSSLVSRKMEAKKRRKLRQRRQKREKEPLKAKSDSAVGDHEPLDVQYGCTVEAVEQTERAYSYVGLRREEGKAVRWRVDGVVIGAELLGVRGTVGAPRERRAALARDPAGRTPSGGG